MSRKIRRATDNTVAARRENRRRQWNRAEVRGHADHGTARTLIVRTEGLNR